MRAVVAWSESAKGVEKGQETPVYDICFNPDGSQMVVAIGNRVLVYDAADGDIIHQLKGHKNTVYCVAYSSDGKRFASGGADKSVIIWTNKAEGILRYSHNDAVQCLAYNPITQQLASMTVTDFGLWSPEQKSVNKYKVSSKILSAGWTNDGQYLALGHLNGIISIRDRNGKEIKAVQRSQPIWAMMWNPCKEEKGDLLCVGCWDQTISFYQLNGQQVGRDRDCGFDPCSVRYFGNGEYIAVGGSDRKASLWTKEGIKLAAIAERDAWVWAAVPRPKHNFVAVGSNDGDLTMYQLIFSTVHGLYQDRYAYRDHMTEVIIQHLITEQKARIKCKEYVKKIAVYKDRLAVQLPDRVVIYELTNDDPYDMLYRVRDKIYRKLECNLLVVTSQHVTLCQERKLQLYDLSGTKEREWVLEAVIRYIKVVGGPSGREGLLVGLKSGLVVKIFTDNPFPIPLVRHKASVRCLDLSISRHKLAVVDEHTNCVVYDLAGHVHGSPLERQPLWTEPNANSVSWNIEMEDMLCFSGNGTLSIKTGSFPIHQQKLQGFVVGFKGSKIFCLHFMAMQTIDVPQSHSMLRFLEIKDFASAYKVACLGVTESDWHLLATEALTDLNFEIARKGFIRVRDMRYIELLNIIQSRSVNTDPQIFLGEILAHQGRYQEAAKVYAKAGHVQKAIDMFSDLRKWEEAQEFAATCSDQVDLKELMRRQAEWSIEINDTSGAAKMWIASGDYEKAIKILTDQKDASGLHELARSLNKMQVRELQLCAAAFTMMDQHEYAREVYVKLGDMKALIEVYVQLNRWEDAIALLPDHPAHKREVYLPYAKWLLSHDRFEEAQESFKLAGDPTLSLRMLEVLAHNAIIERKYSEGSYYYWLLNKEYIKSIAKNAAYTQEGQEMLRLAEETRERAMIYFAYERIYRYVEDPFTSLTGDTIFNTARYLLSTLSTMTNTPFNVSRVYILYALAKQSKDLGAFKLARFAYDKLQSLRTKSEWQDALDMDALTLRSKPFSDKEDLLFMCFNCNTMCPLVNTTGDKCGNCGHPIIRDIITFEALPLVEFCVSRNMTIHDVKRVVGSTAGGGGGGGGGDGWSESNAGGANVMSMDGGGGGGEDLFAELVMNNQATGHEGFDAVLVDQRVLSSMAREEVYYMKPLHPDMPWRYFKSMLPEMPLTLCENSQLFFREEDLEFYMLQHGQAPLTRAKEVAGFKGRDPNNMNQ